MHRFFVVVGSLFIAASAFAAANHFVQLELTNHEPVVAGKDIVVEAKLHRISDGLDVTDEQLATVHTQKLHLLVIDPSLTDYHHVHPTTSAEPGAYEFSFNPKISGGYLAWADITPKETGKQEFVPATIGNITPAKINKTVSYTSTAGGYHFELAFDTPPKRGQASMGTIHITDAAGKEVHSLQPLMGAFGHIVGFYDDLEHVVHVHPIGKEPEQASERGGPDLEFHLEPSQAGFIKMFAQVEINGKDIYAPFGIKVTP